MPIDYSLYPPNWKTEIVPRILYRAGERFQEEMQGDEIVELKQCEALCEECGRENHSSLIGKAPNSIIPVILTVHHMDEDPENWQVKDERLIALCQRCHLARHRGKHAEPRTEDRETNAEGAAVGEAT